MGRGISTFRINAIKTPTQVPSSLKHTINTTRDSSVLRRVGMPLAVLPLVIISELRSMKCTAWNGPRGLASIRP